MSRRSFSPRALGLILAMTAGAWALAAQETPGNKLSLKCSADNATAIRIFYNSGSGPFQFPLIFRAVPNGDPRWNTAPMGFEGRTVYISGGEMQHLLQELDQSALPWQESPKVESLGSFKQIHNSTNTMEILLVCSKGTARTRFDPNRICDALTPLDPALKTPRALWELQIFRLDYGCQVPGFNPDTYPDHY